MLMSNLINFGQSDMRPFIKFACISNFRVLEYIKLNVLHRCSVLCRIGKIPLYRRQTTLCSDNWSNPVASVHD
jgi:hypothetical protein